MRIIVTVIFFCAVSILGQTYSGGAGLSSDPFQIATKSDLIYLSLNSSDWDKHFIQTADITFDSDESQEDWDNSGSSDGAGTSGFSPIGNFTTLFTGNYNGDSYSIVNLFISRTTWVIGLFGAIDGTATLSNIKLIDVDVTSTGNHVAGLVSSTETNTIISKCSVTGTVSGTNFVGGLIAYFKGTVSESYSTCDVSGVSNVGGFIAYIDDITSVSNCYSHGDVTRISGSSSNVGGFAGLVYAEMVYPEIINCYSIGRVVYVDDTNPTENGFVLGDEFELGRYNNNFFDSEASNQSTGLKATAKTTAEMKTQSTFTGWNFSSVWQIIGGDGANYPDLQSNSNSALPVELSSFAASVNGQSVTLNWETATELNNYGFEVERANVIDASTSSAALWEKIGFVEGNGTVNSPKSYSFVDVNSAAGLIQYRLKQIDFDGKFEYSKVVEVEFTTPAEFELAQNYPNPFNPTTNIKFTLPEAAQVRLSVFNMLGEEVGLLANQQMESGIHTVEFDASNLSTGIYFYKLTAADFQQTRKMLLVK